jgi:hypothetical protein
LYGGGPPLYISRSRIPTPLQPLTPSFPIPFPEPEIPASHHPATPRFLLSLLATAVYLSIPSVASQALNSIVGTIGPHTVVQYLNFALGKAIGSLAPDEPSAAVGLEHVAELVPEEETRAGKSCPIEVIPIQTALETKLTDLDIKKEDPSDFASPDDSFFHCPGSENQGPLFHYGAVSDKIGEATACWLARWAPDILAYELEAFSDKDSPLSSVSRPCSRSLADPVAHEVNNASSMKIPVIWARGGVDAKWVSALVSSDALFIKGERERYEFARSVVELRRNDGIEEEEEVQWSNMFRQGIYYSNMVGYFAQVGIYVLISTE